MSTFCCGSSRVLTLKCNSPAAKVWPLLSIVRPVPVLDDSFNPCFILQVLLCQKFGLYSPSWGQFPYWMILSIHASAYQFCARSLAYTRHREASSCTGWFFRFLDGEDAASLGSRGVQNSLAVGCEYLLQSSSSFTINPAKSVSCFQCSCLFMKFLKDLLMTSADASCTKM